MPVQFISVLEGVQHLPSFLTLGIIPRRVVAGIRLDCGIFPVKELDELLVCPPRLGSRKPVARRVRGKQEGRRSGRWWGAGCAKM